MKKIYLKFAVALATGLFVFGCSNDNDVIEKQNNQNVNLSATRAAYDETMTQAEEDAAFQDLFTQLDSLNSEYATNRMQTRIISGETRRILNIAAIDAAGGVVGFLSKAGWVGATITAITA